MRNFAGFLACMAIGICIPFAIVGCQRTLNTGGTTKTEMEQTEANHRRLVASTPPPTFDHSLERENLVRRLKELNVQNKVMYIYLMTMDGKVVAQDLVQGKPSSLNSLLTTPEQVVSIPVAGGGYHYAKLPSPDFDGSYGKNPEGIFYFTPDGAYREWSGTYLLSSRPMTVHTPISLQATVDLEKKKP